MSLEEMTQIAEIVGVTLVVITLIYLAIQVRQGKEILQSEARQAQVDNDLTGVLQIIDNPELGRIFSQKEKPSLDEKTKIMFWIIASMRSREHEWLQYKSGALDEETWTSYRGVIYFVLGTPRSRACWELTRTYFNPEFAEMVTEMMKDVPPIDYWEQLEAIK